MTLGRVLPIVTGCLLMLPAIGLVAAGAGLGAAQLWERDGDGYFDIAVDRLDTSTPVVMVNDLSFAAHSDTPAWILDSLRIDLRLRINGGDDGRERFVGIALDEDVDRYLSGVAYAKIADLADGRVPLYQVEDGSHDIAEPGEQDFWVASASGSGNQEVQWRATDGNWSIVFMNADGSPGVSASVNAGFKVGSLGVFAATVALFGVAIAVAAFALIGHGASVTTAALRA